MAITNGYATLAQMKAAMLRVRTYTATTISFVTDTKTIVDSAYGLKRFQAGDIVQVSGSAENDGHFTVTKGDRAGKLTVSEVLTTEAASATVTIAQVENQIDDVKLESVVEAISRAIDDLTGTRFYTTAENEERFFTASRGNIVRPGDVLSVGELATDSEGDRTYGTVWAETDYDLWPYNAALDGQPYSALKVAPRGAQWFPTISKGVRLTAKFGFSSSAPAQVNESCVLAGEKLFKRRDAIFGVVGGPETGELRYIAAELLRGDTEIGALLSGFMRRLGPMGG